MAIDKRRREGRAGENVNSGGTGIEGKTVRTCAHTVDHEEVVEPVDQRRDPRSAVWDRGRTCDPENHEGAELFDSGQPAALKRDVEVQVQQACGARWDGTVRLQQPAALTRDTARFDT